MKNSTNGNMYTISMEETWELFSPQLSGSRNALVCVLSEKPLELVAKDALDKATLALGYGEHACTFIITAPPDESELDASALFLLIEGLDPVCLIAADEKASRQLQNTYQCPLSPTTLNRALGRTVVSFASFSTMLKDDQEKQQAWALLKRLPKKGAL